MIRYAIVFMSSEMPHLRVLGIQFHSVFALLNRSAVSVPREIVVLNFYTKLTFLCLDKVT